MTNMGLLLWALSIVATAAITIGATLYFRKKKILKWSITTTNLVRDSFSTLPLLIVIYKSREVDTISVSRVAIWNGGNAAIKNEGDVPKGQHIRIVGVTDTEILGYHPVASNQKTNTIGTSDDATNYEARIACNIAFEYIDKKEGAVYQVVHTGESSDDLIVEGTIVEGQLKKTKVDKKGPGFWHTFRAVLPIGSLLFVVALLVIGVGLIVDYQTVIDRLTQNLPKVTLYIVILPLFLPTFYGVFSVVRNLAITTIPKGLEAFHDDPMSEEAKRKTTAEAVAEALEIQKILFDKYGDEVLKDESEDKPK